MSLLGMSELMDFAIGVVGGSIFLGGLQIFWTP